MYFRVYPELTGWGSTPYASSAGENVNIAFASPLAYVEGEGCWVFTTDGSAVTFTLDTNAKTMTISK